jgi:hypothetical protein
MAQLETRLISRSKKYRVPNWGPAVALLLAAALFGWALMTGWRYAAADWLSTEPRHALRQWQEKGIPITDQQWPQLQSRLARAIAYTPGNAVLHDFMAALYAYKGQQAWNELGLRRAFYADAKRHLEFSIELRPGNGRTWISLASARYALGEPDLRIFDAVIKALDHAPHDPALQGLALSILMARWAQAPESLRVWAKRLYEEPQKRSALRMDEKMRQFGVKF